MKHLTALSWNTNIRALASSTLDYCNVLCMWLPLNTVQKLQWVQNMVAKLLRESVREHMTVDANIATAAVVGFWSQFKMLDLTFKFPND